MTSGCNTIKRSSNILSSPSKYVTVVDVYDLAESINRDFESIAEKFGKDCIENIVKKVICALETLEALAKTNDSENAQILDLQKTVENLEYERTQRIREKENLEKDVLDLEENYKKEIDELCNMVKSLQAKNKNLKHELAVAQNKDESFSKSFTSEPGVVTVREEEFQMMLDLRNFSIKQKEQIKDLQKDIETHCAELENLQNNIEKLIAQNKELLRKNTSLQKQGRLLVQERADLLRRLQKLEETNLYLKKSLTFTSQVCKDLEAERQFDRENETSPQFTVEELRDVLREKTLLRARVIELEEQIDFYKTSNLSIASDSTQLLEQEFDKLNVCKKNVSKIKTKMYQRPSTSSLASCYEVLPESKEYNANQNNLSKSNNTEECLVYGPIDREPEEKVNPLKYERKHSGVRKLFRFFKELNTVSEWSPRPSSSLRKKTTLVPSFTTKSQSSYKIDNV